MSPHHVAYLFLLLTSLTRAMCPLDCRCYITNNGRRKTSCIQGGLMGPIPVSSIDHNTQILEIRPTGENPNWLTIGPVFQSLTSLEELHVVKSNVMEIGKHSFWGVKTLEVLNLMENNISALQDHNFRGLANLKELYLNDNKIDRLHSGTFKYLTDLRILSLARNRLDDFVTRAFERLGKLQRLNLNGNKLQELNPQIFMDIQELKILECRNCGLRNINSQIYHLLPHLTTLDLGDNDFHFLAYDEFHDLKKLKTLFLDGNNLPVVLEKMFIYQRNLQKLSFARNRLAKVTTTAFYNVTTLLELDLSFNKLFRLEPAVFTSISESLQILDISGNNLPLEDVKNCLLETKQLRKIGLGSLGLETLPNDFFVINDKLKSLNLSMNNFSSIPIGVTVPLKLTELDMSSNKLVGLNEETMQILEEIPQLHLSHNPWICDQCNILPILGRINKSSIGPSLRPLRCQSPKHLSKKTIGSLELSEIRPCGDSDYLDPSDNFIINLFREHGFVIIIVVTTVSVLVLLVGSIVIVRVCCFRRNVSNYYFEEDKRSTQETVIESAVFGQNGEISFKFPLEKKLSISTIDDIKKETKIANGEL